MRPKGERFLPDATSEKAVRLLGWSPRSREDAIVATAAGVHPAIR